jgi:hypothetical protein
LPRSENEDCNEYEGCRYEHAKKNGSEVSEKWQSSESRRENCQRGQDCRVHRIDERSAATVHLDKNESSAAKYAQNSGA